MRRLIVLALLIVVASTIAVAQDVRMPGLEFGRYHALVIGNNDYRNLPKLETAVGDAETVGNLLKENDGFQVTKLINATRRDITEAFNRPRRTLTERDNLLVNYGYRPASEPGF